MKYTCFMQSVVSPCIIIIVVYAASVYSRLNDTEQNPFYSASNALVGQDNSVLHREWWIKQMYPNPQTFDGSMECGRRGNISWICDPNGILTAEQADSIEMDLDEIRRLTACTCRACSSDEIILGDEEYYGFTIGVALVAKIMPTMKPGDEQTDEDLTAEAQQWAEYLLHDSWKLGNCGNDAVVFISKEDNKIATVAGEMTAEILTVPKIQKIHENNQNHFTNQDYYLGIQMLIKEINATLLNGSEPIGLSSVAIYGIVFLTMCIPLLTFVAVHSMCTNHNGSFRCRKNKKHHRHNPVCVAASV